MLANLKFNIKQTPLIITAFDYFDSLYSLIV